MLFFKIIIVTSCLIASIFEKGCAYPTPGHQRIKIYVPFKVKILHHYNLQRVPIHVPKIIHYHHYDDEHDRNESHLDINDSNSLEDESFQPEDDIQEHKTLENFNEEDDYYYKESPKWQNTDYNDYD